MVSKRTCIDSILLLLLIVGGVFFVATLEVERQDVDEITVADETEMLPFSLAWDLLEVGRTLHDETKYQEAINLYMDIVARSASSTMQKIAYERAGHTYRYWGKYEEAERMFKEAIAIRPDDPWPWVELGKTYRNAQRLEDAEQMFLKALELDSENIDAYAYGLGYLYIEMKEYARAETMFQKARELEPENIFVVTGLADLYREMGRYEESEKLFKEVIDQNPESEAYHGLGMLYTYEGRYEEAIEQFTYFLTHIREKSEVYFALGEAYEGLGDNEKAYEAYLRAVELNPEDTFFNEKLTDFGMIHGLGSG